MEPSAEPSAWSRAVIVATSDASMSQPTNFRPSRFDATAVLPEPKPACLLRVGVSRPDIPYVKTYFRLVKAEARSRIRALRGALRPEPGLRRASPRECCRVSA
jgi:hypothetical protein